MTNHICGDPNSACDAECMDLAHNADLRSSKDQLAELVDQLKPSPDQEERAVAMANEMSKAYWGYRPAARVIIHLQDEIKRLSRPAHEREPPHCSTCACGLAPEPAREYPDPVTAFEKLAEALPDGFQFPAMEPNNEPLTHMEVLSAVHHHASEIVRLTATVPVECSPQPPRDGQ